MKTQSKIQFTYTDKRGNEIHGDVVNPGDWFGKAWIIEIGCGFESLFFAVEADCESDAIDVLADDEKFGHLINVPEEDCAQWIKDLGDNVCLAGNDSHPVDLDNVMMHRAPSTLLYTGEGLPEAGLTPTEYYDFINQ